MRKSIPTKEEIEKAQSEIRNDEKLNQLIIQKANLIKVISPKYKLSGNVSVDENGVYTADKIETIKSPLVEALENKIQERISELIYKYNSTLGLI